jgi:ketosteroid isomerase-like protein
MSRKNVETLREMYRRPTLKEFAESLHPEAELHQSEALVDTDDYYGREEFVRGANRWNEEWDAFRYLVEDVSDLGEQVLMRVRLSGRAKASGIELDMTAFHLWAFRDGLPWRCETFFDREAALEAAEPSE